MTTANDSVLVAPAAPSGAATIATHLLGGKEHQAVVIVEADGHLAGSKPVYCYEIAEQVHVAAATAVHWDLFNAHASLVVRVHGIYQRPSIITAVTGVAFAWTLERTTAVGTGGTPQTAILPDTAQTALDAAITCRTKPSGGATPSTTLRSYSIHGEETNAATIMLHMMMAGGVANLVPPKVCESGGYALRPGQGMSCTQRTNSVAGNTGWGICFTVE